MGLTLRAAAVSDIGLVRANNEDCAFAGRRLIAVADGIGGLPAGELASEIVISVLAVLETDPPPESPEKALELAVTHANGQVRTAGESDEAHDGMGTTVTALLLSGDRVGLVHVGDSRGYMLHDGRLSQLTKDDTFVQTLVDQGVLTAAEARTHPRRSVVTQAIQGLEFEATTADLPARVGDRFLVCSDGLSDVVTNDRIEAALRGVSDPAECAAALVRTALESGATDNVTAVVADVLTE